jgi:DNA (cytosine-5)-methyltransferase 1
VHEALSTLGWTCVLANDIDHVKVQNYSQNFPSTPIIQQDIRDVTTDSIPDALLATASFPCIDLSQAGGRQGISGQHSSLVWSFLAHIAKMRNQGRPPAFLFLENVAGLLTLHNGESIDRLMHEIADLGYSLDLVQVDARHFVPQTRNRVFIIAVLGHQNTSGGEMPDTHIRRYKVHHVFERNRDLPWLFFDFPDPPVVDISLADVLIDLHPSDPRWWDRERTQYFWDHLEHDHRPRLNHMMVTGEDLFLTAVRRGRRRGLREQIFNLRFDGLASCLRTPKGGSSIQFVIRVKDRQVRIRRILGAEAARLQGVDERRYPPFVIPAKEQEALYAFGDAVCVPAVRWVMKHSIEAFLTGESRTPTAQLALEWEAAV